MSKEEEVKSKEKFDEIKAKMNKITKGGVQDLVERRVLLGGIKALQSLINSGVSVDLKEKIKNLKERLEIAKERKPSGRINEDDIKRAGKKAGGSISKLKAGGFPDLSGDGKITKKDVLMGRGVIKRKAGGLAGRLAQRGYGKARS